MVISIYPFFIFLDLKNYKLRPLRSDRMSLHFSILFSIYTILGPILNFSKIGLRQLYRKKINFSKIGLRQLYKKSIWDNFIKEIYHPLVYPYFKICNYKKGTMWIILCVFIFVTMKKELWDTHFYSIFILDVFIMK